MKRVWFLFSSLILVTSLFAQSFKQLSFKGFNGDSVRLSAFSGKKTLFVIAPLSQADSNYRKLLDFKNRYNDFIEVVAVLSLEDGYQPSNANAIAALYANSGIILTEGLYTRKTSGANQSILMRWLTDKNKNYYFNIDPTGTGEKFFVTGSGRLYAVLPPQVSFSDPIIDAIVHSSSR